MKEQQLPEKKQKKTNWIAWGLLLLVILLLIHSNDNEKYEKCVDDCIHENFNCIYDNLLYINPYTNQAVYYILGDEAVDCVDSLDICIQDCKK